MRVAIIPARGGSVRIPRKNIRTFFGRPVMAYSIDTARRSGLFDRVIVSTDSDEVAQVARGHGAEVHRRGEEHAQVGTQAIGTLVVRHLCERDRAPHQACVIYPVAPLLTPEDLEKGLEAMRMRGALFAYSVHEVTLADAGAFYWGEGWAFLHEIDLIGPRTVMVPLPDVRVCDVNTELDWARCVRKYLALHPEMA